jgi:hypothetical protein
MYASGSRLLFGRYSKYIRQWETGMSGGILLRWRNKESDHMPSWNLLRYRKAERTKTMCCGLLWLNGRTYGINRNNGDIGNKRLDTINV